MDRRHFLAASGSFLAALSTGCCPNANGEKVSGEKTLRRLISTVPSITETLFALGLGEKITAVSDYCRYPKGVQDLPKIGGLFNPNIEKIISLDPDLVLLLVENTDLADRLHSFSIETLAVDHSSIEGIFDSFRIIGDRFGSETASQAKILTETIKNRLDTLTKITEPLEKPKVLLCIDRERGIGRIETIYAAGNNRYFNELIKIAGGRNLFGETIAAVPTVSVENLLEKSPEVIFDFAVDWSHSVTDKYAASAVDDWKSLGEAVPAVKYGRIYPIFDDFAAVPGPRFVQLAELLARRLHPEVDFGPDLPPILS